jgi:hypothetical protein
MANQAKTAAVTTSWRGISHVHQNILCAVEKPENGFASQEES